MVATNVATGLEIEGEDHIRPITWEEWITLPVRPQDNAVQTARGPIRVPTVIVADESGIWRRSPDSLTPVTGLCRSRSNSRQTSQQMAMS